MDTVGLGPLLVCLVGKLRGFISTSPGDSYVVPFWASSILSSLIRKQVNATTELHRSLQVGARIVGVEMDPLSLTRVSTQ